ncbi:hypothetical protein MauCBS54593_002345 [Microsporum audouinii]
MDPTQCVSYRLLPDCSTQTLGERFTGRVTVEWKIWTAVDDSSPPTLMEFSYTDGLPDKLNWGLPIYIQEKLKVLTLGSASAIQFPLDLMFPRTSRGEKGALILTIRDLRPRVLPGRLMLLDGIPRCIGGFFFRVMSDSGWNIAAEDIPQATKKWANELLREDSRPYWYRFSLEYCAGVNTIEDICAIFLQYSTKASPFYS